ncbi:uncharacterized protein PRCAT00004140001 [Priceomyces carsonii]|uniref:uncharacterized protein n=1 Tax=Priceomyces carsonii TaxID=28549 RepID=UPI002EDB281B|nr:unnamed protein product [Priceomyces carsonii]
MNERLQERNEQKYTLPSSLITNLNECIFDNVSIDYFPLVIIVKSTDTNVIETLKEEESWLISTRYKANIRVNCTNRQASEKLLTRLIEEKIPFNADYSNFISHPGNLFVKYLTSDLINHDKLFEYFNGASKYKSLNEINILKSKGDESFAILKFDIHMDCDYLIRSLKPVPNPFNTNPYTPLYLNKYINRKERTLWSSNDEHLPPQSLGGDPMDMHEGNNNNVYDSIVLENLDKFFGSHKITIEVFERFLEKLSSFNDIDLIYFPVKMRSDEDNIKFEPFGYINFVHGDNLNNQVLKCLYCLSNITFEQFMDFDEKNMSFEYYPNKAEDDRDDDVFDENTIRISINQHKFNHYLYKSSTNQMCITLAPSISLGYLNLPYYNLILARFLKYINYQETNLYVNNLCVLFRNDDDLWESFWSQFGKINSAKIIKPDFYSKTSTTNFGKIGFIFFKKFRMAVRAILLTNNKQICFNNQSLKIESSFAIQKSMHTKAHTSRSVDMGQFYYYAPPFVPSIPTPMYSVPMPVDYVSYYNPYYYPNNCIDNRGEEDNYRQKNDR